MSKGQGDTITELERFKEMSAQVKQSKTQSDTKRFLRKEMDSKQRKIDKFLQTLAIYEQKNLLKHDEKVISYRTLNLIHTYTKLWSIQTFRYSRFQQSAS